MRILIIEDEKITADDLVHSIKEVRPNFEILNTVSSVKTATAFLKTNPLIDLIFSDIQLTDGLSFEIFKKVKINVPVIFCTAYDEYALNAFDVNGIAYILKPFTTETIRSAIEKFERLTQQKDDKLTKLIQYMEQTNQVKTSASILVYQGEKIIPVSFKDIALIYLKNGMVKLHTFDNQLFSVSETLEELEKLNGFNFFRANRQFLVHHEAIKNAAKYFNRRLVLQLHINFDEKVIISKEKAPAFLDWLANS